MRRTTSILFALILAGCSSASTNPVADTLAETVADVSLSDSTDAAPALDLAADAVEAETVEPPQPRLLTFRAIGGMSMGAGALNFHSHNPGRVDVVAALGGYMNYSYLLDMLQRQVFGGFCDRELLEAHLDDLNDPDAPALQCGLAEPQFPWEFAQNFNAFHPDYSGGTWDRDTYLESVEALTTAFGNLFSYNPDNPILPPGVPASWLAETTAQEKCAEPLVIEKPWNYSAEYNPEGTYSLVTFCDGEEPIPDGKENPDYWSLLGAYDPTMPHTRPVTMVLAVDYNGNGLRDYHEPLVINVRERFQDVGSDGCANADEDGAGGCTGGAEGDDPNGDDFDTFDNPMGTSGDHIWQPGEPFEDFGLDGVADTGDYGEGDGEYSLSPHWQALLNTTGMHWIATASDHELAATDVFLDGGIRDGLQSLTGTYRIASLLLSRATDTRIYDNFTGTPDSVYPSNSPMMLNPVYDEVDWSAEGMGKNFLVMYGSEDASPEAVEDGDGKHVGSPVQLLNRVAMYIYSSLARWPDLDVEPCPGKPAKIMPGSFYSQALGSRFGYSISIPPCYDTSDLTYPVIFFLPGQGMWAQDVTATNVLFNFAMQTGDVPKYIEVAPEGQCCRIHEPTGTRYCACLKNEADGSVMTCVEPQCKAPHDECATVDVPKAELVQECPGGCVFANQVSDQFGNVAAAAHMRYEDMLLDLMDHVDATYKVRPPQQ